MSCQNRLRQGAASELEIRSVRFEIQTCISNPAIYDERCTKLQRPSRPLTQAVLTVRGQLRPLRKTLRSQRGTDVNAEFAEENAKRGAK